MDPTLYFRCLTEMGNRESEEIKRKQKYWQLMHINNKKFFHSTIYACLVHIELKCKASYFVLPLTSAIR